MKTYAALLLLLTVTGIVSSAQANFDHGTWNTLLIDNVTELREGRATQVNYAGMQRDAAKLTSYLDDLAGVSKADFDQWDNSEQLAFLINAYNAWTVDYVLSAYPNLDSIKDLGSFFNSPWSHQVVSLFGDKVSLDEIEHEMIRGWNRYNEPRIHFAVNCAAIGCPALGATAFTGENLESLLELNTKRFLSDETRNYYDNGRFYLSKIFDWYEEDFEKGWGGYNSLAEFIAHYQSAMNLNAQAIQALAGGRIRARYTSYDWDLNRAP